MYWGSYFGKLSSRHREDYRSAKRCNSVFRMQPRDHSVIDDGVLVAVIEDSIPALQARVQGLGFTGLAPKTH